MNISKATKQIAALVLVAAVALIPTGGWSVLFSGFAGDAYVAELNLEDGDITIDRDGVMQNGETLGYSSQGPFLIRGDGSGGALELYDGIETTLKLDDGTRLYQFSIHDDVTANITLGQSSFIDEMAVGRGAAPRLTVAQGVDILTLDCAEDTDIVLRDADESGSLNLHGVVNGASFFADVSRALTINGYSNMKVRLVKQGGGNLLLTAIDAPDAVIREGTLTMEDNNDPMTGSFLVEADGTLQFNSDHDISYGGSLSGAGVVVKYGANTLALTHPGNTFTGNTIIEEGVLQIGDDNHPSFLGGNVTIGGGAVLLYHYTGQDPLPLGGHYSGDGAFYKTGSGTIILTGDNTYSGGTRVADGTLQIGDNTEQGSIPWNIVVDPSATLAINRSNQVDLSGYLDIQGTLAKLGDGQLNLDNLNALGTLALYSGTLAVEDDLTAERAYIFGGSLKLWLDTDQSKTPVTVNGELHISGESALWTSGIYNVPYGEVRNLLLANSIDGSFHSYYVDNPEEDYLVAAMLLTPENNPTRIAVSKDLNWYAHPSSANGVFTIPDAETYILNRDLMDVDNGDNGFASGWNGKTLVKKGSGTLLLRMPNSNTGGIDIREGTLVSKNHLPLSGGPIRIADDAKLQLEASGTSKLSNSISGDGNIQLLGGGTLLMDGAHTSSGYLFVDEGELQTAGWSGSVYVAKGSSIHPLDSYVKIDGTLNLFGHLRMEHSLPLKVGDAILEDGAVIQINTTGLVDGRYPLLEATNGKIELGDVILQLDGIAKKKPYSLKTNNAKTLLYLVLGQEPEVTDPFFVYFDDSGVVTAYMISAPGDAVGDKVWPIPEKSGYRFGGWFTNREGSGERFTASTPVKRSVNLFAHWIPEEPSTTEAPDTAKQVVAKAPASTQAAKEDPPPQEEDPAPSRPGWTPLYAKYDLSGANELEAEAEASIPEPLEDGEIPAWASEGSAAVAEAPPTYWVESDEAQILYKSALNAGQDYIHANRTTSTAIRKNALATLVGVRYEYDTILGNQVQTRVTIPEPTAATKDIYLSGAIAGPEVNKLKAQLSKWFRNEIAVICMEHQGGFGLTVQISVRADLSRMDTEKLYLYGYDRATHLYTPISDSNHWIDANGYLRFTTKVGGDIIVSEGPLLRQ